MIPYEGWGLRSSEMERYVGLLDRARTRHDVVYNHWTSLIQLHIITSQKTWSLNETGLETSNLARQEGHCSAVTIERISNIFMQNCLCRFVVALENWYTEGKPPNDEFFRWGDWFFLESSVIISLSHFAMSGRLQMFLFRHAVWVTEIIVKLTGHE